MYLECAIKGIILMTRKKKMVPGAGIEPAWDVKSRGILNPLRLPISPPGHLKKVF